MVEFLRARGAKSYNKLFDLPDYRQCKQEPGKSILAKSKAKYEARYALRPLSDCKQRIRRFYSAAYTFPSSSCTKDIYLDLLAQADLTRPQYSKLFLKSIL
jgi:hypothetical protein